MKNKHYTLIGAMTFAMAIGFAFTLPPEDVIRMTIVKHEDGQVTVYDTIVDVLSGYTIENYLISKNIKPSETEIIHTNNLPHGVATHEAGTNNSYRHSKNVMIMENIENENGAENVVTISKSVDAHGNSKIEKKVNGEIVEYDGNPEDLLFESIELTLGQNTESEENIDIQVIKQIISADIDSSQELSENVSGNQVYYFDYDDINDDGDEESDMNVKQIVYSNDTPEDEGVQNYIVSYNFNTTGEDSSPVVLSSTQSSNKTIAIVTRELYEHQRYGDGGPVFVVSGIDENKKLDIENLSYFPNPSNGQLRLSFNLPESGQTQITVFDLAGKEVYDKPLGNFQGDYNEQLNLTNLESGTYIMRISQNNLSLAEKLIIK